MKSLTKELGKFTAEDSVRHPSESDPSLVHLQFELDRIRGLVQLAVRHWQDAGRDPNNAFQGLVVADDEAAHLAELPFGYSWGDLANGAHSGDDGRRFRGSEETGHGVNGASGEYERLAEAAMAQGGSLRLNLLCETFALSAYERDAFLLCLAPALDLRFEQIFGFLQNDVNCRRPTVSLLVNLLSTPGFARMRAIQCFGAGSRLLRSRLLLPVREPSAVEPSQLAQALMVDRTIVAWLLGYYEPPSQLQRLVAFKDGAFAEHAPLAEEIVANLEAVTAIRNAVLLLHGADEGAQLAAADRFAALLGRGLLEISIKELAVQGAEVPLLLSMALRDARLLGALPLLVGWDALLANQESPANVLDILLTFPGPVLVCSKSFWRPSGSATQRSILSVACDMPDYSQRKVIWSHYLHDLDLDSDVDAVALAGQFTLDTGQIHDAIAAARDRAAQRSAAISQADLFAGARVHSGTKLSDLARKITPRYDWEDIILPDDQVQILRELVATVRGRSQVLDEWGLGKKLASSAAVTVLFSGPPGTGKTMSAEVIAQDLGLDLYKIDLSSLVSKYIGETEKNLERIFSAAQSSNAILFFDEADAIFGKRSGVKDARDRYANIEISYLLQRMEVYDGVTILATNLRSNMDEAFMRRLQFAVDIPFPDEQDRLRIWETLFPDSVPKAADVQFDELARRFKLAGGNIRNVILSAAFQAAGDEGTITMAHLLHGIRREFQKMGRLVPGQ